MRRVAKTSLKEHFDGFKLIFADDTLTENMILVCFLWSGNYNQLFVLFKGVSIVLDYRLLNTRYNLSNIFG